MFIGFLHTRVHTASYVIMLDFENKIIVVTGAAGGIGQAVALELAAAGAIIVMADIQTETQEVVVSQIKANGGQAFSYHCDVSNDDSVSKFAASVLDSIGVPDVLYNNAVFFRTGGILNIDLDILRREFDVNVLGYIRIAQNFLPAMIDRGSGWIANTASPNAFVPPQPVAEGMLGYCITKGAEAALTQCMAKSLKSTGVGVSLVIPDVTYTESALNISGNASDEWHENFKRFFTKISRPAGDVAKLLVQGLREEKYLVSAHPGFDNVLREWVQNDLDPHPDYLRRQD
ncbi:unnamed protein product [Clonostachys rosea f. rosea IK726]|jgi:NAD(P)-dependent dehydrogenase (short-subunit alcohol dehydrogenase family)|uniref:Uncharacterized protein n=1 Tax=Clonostachys rosea f. rosea IK726 TaxID=1349383 RepID=A0ACA9UHQ6_BIOOC|nr:unnamed protein product [Clonostachys rosea f. rosea IK726]